MAVYLYNVLFIHFLTSSCATNRQQIDAVTRTERRQRVMICDQWAIKDGDQHSNSPLAPVCLQPIAQTT